MMTMSLSMLKILKIFEVLIFIVLEPEILYMKLYESSFSFVERNVNIKSEMSLEYNE